MGSRRTRGDIKRTREQWTNPDLEEDDEEKEVQKKLDFRNIFGEKI